MGTKIGVGLSVLKNPYEAGRDASKEAVKRLDKNDNLLVLVFTTDDYENESVIKGIKDVIDSPNIAGFVSAGVFIGRNVEKSGVAVGVIQSDEMEYVVEAEERLSVSMETAGRNIGLRFKEYLKNTSKEALTLVLPDGLTNTVSEIVYSLFNELGMRTKYAGGGAGDNLKFLKTYQFIQDKVLRDAVVSALILSSKPIGVSLSHGWETISSPMIVTMAKGNVVKELDWQSASDVYIDVISRYENKPISELPFAEIAMKHPFGIPVTKDGVNYIIRDPIKKEDDGSIVCVGDVPENIVVRVMYGDKDSLLNAVKKATYDAMEQIGNNKPAGVIVFSCVSRCILLGDSFGDEIKTISEIVGTDVPIIGCLTFGEIGSFAGGAPEYHNKSVSLCIFPS